MASLNISDPTLDDDECGVGYSARTKKMEDWLRKAFKKHGNELSYQKRAALDNHHDTLTLAGCFFELLVLKTHGVIDVIQGSAFGEITIRKGAKWHVD
jgi:chromatin segregation and condensation protein Rec8/ScpA/Scc1 (kleisin family)